VLFCRRVAAVDTKDSIDLLTFELDRDTFQHVIIFSQNFSSSKFVFHVYITKKFERKKSKVLRSMGFAESSKAGSKFVGMKLKS
jgi:hypothetical protein